MPESRNEPSLSITRVATNLDWSHGERLQAIMDDRHFALNRIKLFLTKESDESIVTLLGAGELRAFYRKIGVIPTVLTIENLANHLDENLPDSVDEPLCVPSRPVAEIVLPTRHSSILVALAANNPQLLRERRAAQRLVSEFYGFRPDAYIRTDTIDEPLWYPADYRASVWIARSRRLSIAAELREALESGAGRGLIPDFIELEFASIDEDDVG